ncbi:MAG: ribulose 1,5-bisphosphate carboxylase [Acidimicrobiales bacterium]
MEEWLRVTYRVSAPAGEIEARARAIALEQSIEMSLEAVANRWVKDHVAGRVEAISATSAEPSAEPNAEPNAFYDVVIALAAVTVGTNPAQLLSMLFGNVSLQSDVQLVDVDLPDSVLAAFAGPNHGLEGLRKLTGAHTRALTCTALKPQGAPSAELAHLCHTFAEAGIDAVKDDHGLADQATAPFAERVAACQRAVAATGSPTLYVPSLVGGPRRVARQLAIAKGEGVRAVLMAPALYGLPAFAELVEDNPDLVFLGHPAFAGTARMSPRLLFGRLFRLYGADAVIYPNHGGRFAFSRPDCLGIAEAARARWGIFKPAVPVPAGGMPVERVGEMLEFYGPDVMLLISGDLLRSTDVAARARRFVAAVHGS